MPEDAPERVGPGRDRFRQAPRVGFRRELWLLVREAYLHARRAGPAARASVLTGASSGLKTGPQQRAVAERVLSNEDSLC